MPETKEMEVYQNSIQARATGDEIASNPFGSFSWMFAHSGEIISPWWSRQRDAELDQFVKSSDHVSGTLGLLASKVASVPVQVMPRDTSVTTHWKQAEEYNIILNENAEFGQGWITAVRKWLYDFWGSDNGAFFEIIGEDGKRGRSSKAIELTQKERMQIGIVAGPIVGPAQGIANLDSLRVTRTGDPEYPILYNDTDGKMYRLHWTRVAYSSDMPSARAEMLGVGFCAVSRWINYGQSMIDISVYKQEKLGSRPLRAIITGKRIMTEHILNAIHIAEESMDNKGLRRMSKIPIIGDLQADASIEIIDLASLPDGFDEDTWVRLGMFTGALAFKVPIRWIWPASSAGATKADAMFQHIAGLGGGIGEVLAILTMLLGGDPRGSKHSVGKFLPPHLKLVFDFQDDEQDRSRAEIKELRAKTRELELKSGIITPRIARVQAVEGGDISKTQFEEMELDEGRLGDGSDILSLFSSTDNFFLDLLDLGVEEPLAINVNDPFEMIVEITLAALNAQDKIMNAGSATERLKARQALAALGKLKNLYTPLVTEEVQTDEEMKQELEDKKEFNFSVPVGEVIKGQLARGAGGRFVNVEELKAQLRGEISNRLRSRSGGSSREGAATRKRENNREQVASKLGIGTDTVETLKNMREGTEADSSSLLGSGLVEQNPNGSITMTSAGRSLLAAANSGDVDKAKSALAKAKEPKKEPKSGKPKKSEEDRERERQEKLAERERQRNEKIASNRESVNNALGSDSEGIDELREFADGGTIEQEMAQELSRRGLVEFDPEGQPRMTSAGRTLLSASDAGNTRLALDSISRAKERIRGIIERVSSKREQSDRTVLDSTQRANSKRSRAIELEQEADDLDIEIEELDSIAGSKDLESEQLLREIKNSNDEKEISRLETKLTRTREQAEIIRKRIIEKRERAEKNRKRSLEELAEADKIESDAEARSEQLKDEAEKLENTIGGAYLEEIEEKGLWKKFKQIFGKKQAYEQQQHQYELVNMVCPVCKGNIARCYLGHKGLCVCDECGITFDPEIEG